MSAPANPALPGVPHARVAIAFGFPLEIKTDYLPAAVTCTLEMTFPKPAQKALAARLRLLADMMEKAA